jgi:DNA-binding NarL/FixJ family response regulator
VNGGPFRVVVVEDDVGVRRLFHDWLDADARFLVVGEAADGDVAVDMVGRLRPDAVLLDLRAPRVAGEVAVPRLRELSPSTSVVVVTGRDELLAEAEWLGADGVFPKGATVTAALDGLVSTVARGPRTGGAGRRT